MGKDGAQVGGPWAALPIPPGLCPPSLQHTFYVGQDSSRSVACMVDSSLGVWVTLKGSAHVCLYHPDTFEQLAEVDVTPPVHKMLAGTDFPLPSWGRPWQGQPKAQLCCFPPRLRRHHPAAQGSLPENHSAVGVCRAAVGGHQCWGCADYTHLSKHRQLPTSTSQPGWPMPGPHRPCPLPGCSPAA